MANLWYIVAASVLWGIAPIFTKGLSEQGVAAIEIAVMRAVLAAVVYLLFAAVKTPQIFQCPPKRIFKLMVSGAISMGVMYLTYPLAMELLDVSLAVVFLYTAPIYVTIFFALRREEPLTLMRMLSLCCIMVGAACTCGILESGGVSYTPMGLFVGVVCGVSYALVTIFRKTVQADATTQEVATYATLGAAVILMIACPPFHIEISADTIFYFAGNSIVSTVLPMFFYLRGLERGVKGSVASSVAALELLVAVLCGFLLLQEPMTGGKMIGILFVFWGTLFGIR